MGVGKSTVAAHLSSQLHSPLIDSDYEIERQVGQSLVAYINEAGINAFRQLETDLLHVCLKKNPLILACGGGLVLAEENRSLLAQFELVIYLQTCLAQQVQRLQEETNHRFFADNGGSLAEKLHSLNSDRIPYCVRLANFVINTDDLSSQEVAKEIIERLNAQN